LKYINDFPAFYVQNIKHRIAHTKQHLLIFGDIFLSLVKELVLR